MIIEAIATTVMAMSGSCVDDMTCQALSVSVS